MFKANNTGNNKKMADVNAPDRLNRIVEGTVIQGEINADSNLRIDGTVKGEISTKGRLVVGVNGRIEGNIICQNADIEGEIIGTIKVEDLLSLKSTAKLNGEMTTKKLHIEPGADFTGSCTMSNTSKKTSSNLDKTNVTVEKILEEHN
jgi:cytoskeletal protein CcmA (bactofilin family)